ncbi:MAG: hypothetical protein N3C60_06255 [Calditerrivibrio sp.]|nr:hypothetical protein [Calditerrivibrio sp.]
MRDEHLKKQISLIYALSSKISLALAITFTLLSIILRVAGHQNSFIYLFGMIIIFLLIATPFFGVLTALIYYVKEKNKIMALAALGIILIILSAIVKGYIFR